MTIIIIKIFLKFINVCIKGACSALVIINKFDVMYEEACLFKEIYLIDKYLKIVRFLIVRPLYHLFVKNCRGLYGVFLL